MGWGVGSWKLRRQLAWSSKKDSTSKQVRANTQMHAHALISKARACTRAHIEVLIIAWLLDISLDTSL